MDTRRVNADIALKNLTEQTLQIENVSLSDLWGIQHKNVKRLSEKFPTCQITVRGEKIRIRGTEEDIESVKQTLNLLVQHVQQTPQPKSEQDENLLERKVFNPSNMKTPNQITPPHFLLHAPNKEKIYAQTPNQQDLAASILNKDLVFAVGPAGTGKTFLAMTLAIRALKEGEIEKIIITRPIVEAGERLGFLPGDMKEKIDPYLRPVYDALGRLLSPERVQYFQKEGLLEIAPLAYMRGRTLSQAFVLLDEGQNTTPAQMKMFLTRLGPGSKMVITGDPSQIDLPKQQPSGFIDVIKRLKHASEVSICYLDQEDVIRHKLVQIIINAYKKSDTD
ncbi:MAG: PhoH family protein [Cytophagales bacterium]|nr:PhoH family protein [Cytophagales bacterium]